MKAEGAPRVLVLGGLEPSGRAGLLADVEAVRAAGGRPLAVATCLTAQGARTYLSRPVEPEVLSAQLRSLLELGPVDAVKLGAVPGPAAWTAICRVLRRSRCPVVVDPVLRTSRGQPLSTLRRADFRRGAGPRWVFTPNLDEARWLLGAAARRVQATPEALAAALVEAGFGAVVVKGGHGEGPRSVDAVGTGAGVVSLAAARLSRAGRLHRGTGCRFAAALATYLARGQSLPAAARSAQRQVRRYLRGPAPA